MSTEPALYPPSYLLGAYAGGGSVTETASESRRLSSAREVAVCSPCWVKRGSDLVTSESSMPVASVVVVSLDMAR